MALCLVTSCTGLRASDNIEVELARETVASANSTASSPALFSPKAYLIKWPPAEGSS